jgi:endonuclease-3
MNKETRYEIMRRLAEIRPNPQSELNYTTPFELLVAVVLSAQATDKGVNIATAKLFPVANTPEAIAALGVEGLTPYIKTIGLYRNKAKNVIALSEILRDRFNSTVPANREDLESLPGVGRKTANVVLNVAFGQPTIAVDTHIFRVSNRTGFAVGDRKMRKILVREPHCHVPEAVLVRHEIDESLRAIRIQFQNVLRCQAIVVCVHLWEMRKLVTEVFHIQLQFIIF